MSVELLEEAAAALGEIRNDVVFLGAATLSLWITDEAAPPLRPTSDVDVVVVEVTTLIEYNRFEARLRSAGFRDEGSVLGRFLFGPDDLQVDAIPADASILGFENQWQRAALSEAVERSLPSGAVIRCVPPAYLLATKLEAFAGRGEGDYFGSPDFEDIVALVDGRAELVDEVKASNSSLRAYVSAELGEHLEKTRGRDAVIAHLEYGRDGRPRAEGTVIPRLTQIATSGT